MRPDICYCISCGGVILPVDEAWHDDVSDSWMCEICLDAWQLRLLDEEMEPGVYSHEEEENDENQ